MPVGQRLDWPDGDFRFQPGFWPLAEADDLLAALDALPDWRQHHVRLFGREVPSPRLSAWYGDDGTAYRYSGVRHVPLPWPPLLERVRQQLQHATGHAFNAVLANRYHDGGDAMGWHSDNEPELGARPVIASASFGATRRFLLRHRASGRREALELTHGSLLLMAGDSQRCWQHAVPRTRRPCGLRINLTYRYVHPS
jgi:alkylated DNA repair dioxygenase AlkB